MYNKINFSKFFKIANIFSAIAILISILFLFLKGLNFVIYRPKVICIEILGFDKYDAKKEIEIKKNEVYIFLLKNGYKKVWSNSHFMSHIFTSN